MKSYLTILVAILFVLVVCQNNVQAQKAKGLLNKGARSIENGATTVENGQATVEKGKETAKKGKVF